MRVAIFTDNDFDKTNGVTTTLSAVLRHAPCDLRPRIYTMSDVGCDTDDYLGLASVGVPIPWYGEMRMYAPRLRAFRRNLREDGAALIHMTTPGPVGLAAKYLASRMGLPTIGSFHTYLAQYTTILSGSNRRGRLMDQYMRWLYGACESLLVPSNDTREQLERSGWRAERMTVWSRGVDAEAFSPTRRSPALREQWRVCDRRPALIYAGRLSPEKGLMLLPRLESALHRQRASYRLIVAGDGPMLQELRAACPDAVFLGRVRHDQMGVAMASADLLVFPSETDTAGNVVLEAQASGLPVIVSDKGGPREQMRPGETGIVCPAGDEDAFADAVARVLKTSGRRAAMSAAAREFAATRRWQAALEPLFAAYRAAIAPERVQTLARLGTRAGIVTR